jgi:hypothetical protein
MIPNRFILLLSAILVAIPCAALFVCPAAIAAQLLPAASVALMGLIAGAVVQYSVCLSGGGVSINQVVSREADHPNPYTKTLIIGQAGTLSTRTSDTVGVFTLSSGHGITDAMTVDVYWSGAYRYGCTVTAYDATTVTIGVGAKTGGTVLPAQTTACTICKRETVNTHIDADAAEIIAFCSVRAADTDTTTTRTLLAFYDVSDALVGSVVVLVGKTPTVIDVHGGDTNPITGNPITYCEATQEGTAETAALTIFSLEDATP